MELEVVDSRREKTPAFHMTLDLSVKAFLPQTNS
ncbi:MAG: hypothetical protein SCARUB_03451 [Candidatus Scalindua rubra]|uniref:Uncharacterized protein n=1 Tax=Candidatus Scalindua rubra TaxID=1872076 RepID=A0A1E3X731_9BACT|nr:MAG: hypothetical protein SCARUB_03451 [Candidatus Scalindua rubra]